MDYRRARKLEENVWRVDHRRSTVLTIALCRRRVRYQRTIRLNDFPRATPAQSLAAALRVARRQLREWNARYGPPRTGPQLGHQIGGPVVARSGIRGVHCHHRNGWSAVWYEEGVKHRVHCGPGTAGLAKATRLRQAAERRLHAAFRARQRTAGLR